MWLVCSLVRQTIGLWRFNANALTRAYNERFIVKSFESDTFVQESAWTSDLHDLPDILLIFVDYSVSVTSMAPSPLPTATTVTRRYSRRKRIQPRTSNVLRLCQINEKIVFDVSAEVHRLKRTISTRGQAAEAPRINWNVDRNIRTQSAEKIRRGMDRYELNVERSWKATDRSFARSRIANSRVRLKTDSSTESRPCQLANESSSFRQALEMEHNGSVLLTRDACNRYSRFPDVSSVIL